MATDTGWIRHHRKEQYSAIWSRPPLYQKVWDWLKLNVDYRTGELDTTAPHIADRVQWVENNRPRIPNRKTIHDILAFLESEGMIKRIIRGSRNALYIHITICNWLVYNPLDGRARNPVETPEKPQLVGTTQEVQESSPEGELLVSTAKSVQDRLDAQPPEAQQILTDRWIAHAPLPPTSVRSPSARLKLLDTIRLMHTQDGLGWDLIGSIVEHAATHWQPKGYMLSPAKLRSQKDGVPYYEIIRSQMANTGGNGTPRPRTSLPATRTYSRNAEDWK